MPRQNRPVVKDGRLQVKKKRTDRSYLQPTVPSMDEPAPGADTPTIGSEVLPEALPAAVVAATPPPAPPIAPPSSAVAPTASDARRPAYNSTARALQQQGVRKRREVDIEAVARRDSDYAIHELRRIAVLAALVVIVLIVLALTLR